MIAFSSSPKSDTFFDWFSAHFQETNEKIMSTTRPNTTKQNWQECCGSTGY